MNGTMTAVDLRTLQGNILRSYGGAFPVVRYLVLAVRDAHVARAALGSMVDGNRATPEVTAADPNPKDAGMDWCLNVGLTFRGLEAIGLPEASLETFPPEFREGMVARAARLGDVGDSAPGRWIPGLADADQVHLLVSLHARRDHDLDRLTREVLYLGRGRAFDLVTSDPIDGRHMTDKDGGHIVHFGYRDGISQPKFEVIHPEPGVVPAQAGFTPLGAVLLGHPVEALGMTWRVPQPDVLGRNGSFTAFRVLQQDVPAFEAFLETEAEAHGCGVEEVAAKICGRWRNGVPLTEAATEEDAEKLAGQTINTFGYRRNDAAGDCCPLGSHIRRTNPRDANIVQRGSNALRTIVRRGVPYGGMYDPDHPGSAAEPRGLLGSFLCASLAAQFEAMQCDWVNLGLLDPRITGTNDPLVGANDGRTTAFHWTTSDHKRVVSPAVPRFVHTRGGAYAFIASMPALRWIAAGSWCRSPWRWLPGGLGGRPR
ncbi:MAG: Dyp-type peroxidase [Acidimicrobiales bacterium]